MGLSGAANFGIAVAGFGLSVASAENLDEKEVLVSKEAAIDLLSQFESEIEAQQVVERREAIGVLYELPAGAEYGPSDPTMPITELRRDIEGSMAGAVPAPEIWYEDGYFASIVAIDWQCAWLSQSVKSSRENDSAAVASALDVLARFGASEYAQAFPDYEEVFLAEIANPVESGDLTEATSYLANVCLPETRVDL